jgi:amidase
VGDGVLTRTVDETARVLDLLAGYEVGDLTWAPPADEPFAAAAAREPGKLRIGLTTKTPLPDSPVDPACARAARDAAQLLESLGHTVEEVDPPWQDKTLLQVFTAVFGPAVTLQMVFAMTVAGREITAADTEPLSWAIWETCNGITATQAAAAEAQLHAFARTIIRWADPYDAILTPALAEAPVTIGTIDPTDPTHPMATFARSGQFTPYTAISNVTGVPAIALPLYERDEDDGAPGVPLAVQLIGRPAQEGALLALARQIEQAAPWVDRRPRLS